MINKINYKPKIIIGVALYILSNICFCDYGLCQRIPWELSGYVVNDAEQTEFFLQVKNVGDFAASNITGILTIGDDQIVIGTEREIPPFAAGAFNYKVQNIHYILPGRYLIPFRINYQSIANIKEEKVFLAQLENSPSRATGIEMTTQPIVLSKSNNTTLTIENTDPWDKVISLEPVVINSVSIKLDEEKIILPKNSTKTLGLTISANNLLAKTNIYIIGRYQKNNEMYSSNADIEIDPVTKTSLLEKIFSRTIMICFTVILALAAFVFDYRDRKMSIK